MRRGLRTTCRTAGSRRGVCSCDSYLRQLGSRHLYCCCGLRCLHILLAGPRRRDSADTRSCMLYLVGVIIVCWVVNCRLLVGSVTAFRISV